MGFPKKTHIEFFTSLMEENSVPSLFESTSYFNNKLRNDASNYSDDSSSSIYSLRLVPEYINLKMGNPNNWSRKVIKHFNWGYAIHLDGFESIDAYLQAQFKSKYRSIIRRYVNRLEHCFPISYKLYFGEMERKQYEFIMSALHGMIVDRFGQRQETHKDFYRWEDLSTEMYQRILHKKASLFVIYDRDKPIQISLNYHFDKILFSAISSYDIDYAKFGLGHVEIYKQLEWCISNKFCIYEMGVGGMDYKRRWSNNIYQYEHHVVFISNSITNKIATGLEIARIELKEYLKRKKINDWIYELKSKVLGNSKSDNSIEKNVQVTGVENHFEASEYTLCDIASSNFKNLRKYIYDFAYTNVDKVSEIQLWLSNSSTNEYLIKGSSKQVLLVIS